MNTHRNPDKTADQKAIETVVALFFGIPLGIAVAILVWTMCVNHVDANASTQAVHQVQNGGVAR